jgi:hypothetical protein
VSEVVGVDVAVLVTEEAAVPVDVAVLVTEEAAVPVNVAALVDVPVPVTVIDDVGVPVAVADDVAVPVDVPELVLDAVAVFEGVGGSPFGQDPKPSSAYKLQIPASKLNASQVGVLAHKVPQAATSNNAVPEI